MAFPSALPLLSSVPALHHLLHPALLLPHVHRQLQGQRQALPPPLRAAGEREIYHLMGLHFVKYDIC